LLERKIGENKKQNRLVPSGKKPCYDDVNPFRSLLKAAVIFVPLLGSTWVFGILSVNEDTVVFAWIFTILNSLQVCKHVWGKQCTF